MFSLFHNYKYTFMTIHHLFFVYTFLQHILTGVSVRLCRKRQTECKYHRNVSVSMWTYRNTHHVNYKPIYFVYTVIRSYNQVILFQIQGWHSLETSKWHFLFNINFQYCSVWQLLSAMHVPIARGKFPQIKKQTETVRVSYTCTCYQLYYTHFFSLCLFESFLVKSTYF